MGEPVEPAGLAGKAVRAVLGVPAPRVAPRARRAGLAGLEVRAVLAVWVAPAATELCSPGTVVPVERAGWLVAAGLVVWAVLLPLQEAVLVALAGPAG